MTIKGLKELQTFLDQLPVKMEKNIMRSALRAGIKVPKAEAQALLEAHGNIITSALSKGLKISTKTNGSRVTATLKATGKHAYVAYWLEYTGAAPHIIKSKDGKALSFAGGIYQAIHHPGFHKQPFMRPALDLTVNAAVIAMADQIKKRLTKEGIDASDVDVEAE